MRSQAVVAVLVTLLRAAVHYVHVVVPLIDVTSARIAELEGYLSNHELYERMVSAHTSYPHLTHLYSIGRSVKGEFHKHNFTDLLGTAVKSEIASTGA